MNTRQIMTSTPTLLILAVLMLFGAVFLSNSDRANANPSSFIRSSTSATNNTVTATSSVTSSVNGGTGTTTIVLNGTLGSNFAANTASLSLFRMASSGRLISKIDIQYSMNCDATAPDWYSVHGSSTAAVTGSILLPFASTTPVGGGVVSDSDQTEIQLGNMPTKCMRALITTPIGISGSSTVWGELIGKKEQY